MTSPGARLVRATIGVFFGVALAAATCGAPRVVTPAATPSPSPSPTWTPIPFATATPRPTPTPTHTPTVEAVPTPPPATTAETEASPAVVTPPPPTASPEELARYTAEELQARLPDPTVLSERLGLPVLAGPDEDITAATYGLQDQFLDPLLIRRLDPFLFALLFVGQTASSAEQFLADNLLNAPGPFLETVASGLAEGFQSSDRPAAVVALVVQEPPSVGERSAAARTRVVSGTDAFEARLLVAEQADILVLILQIARVDQGSTAALLDDIGLASAVLGSEIPRG